MKNKILKGTGIFVCLLCAALTVSFMNHKIRLNKEKDLLNPLGEMVQVDGAEMCVYSEGQGEKTLVFMSGSGTCSPILDFRSLYSSLSDTYKIAVVEKFGYGFSDITDKSRDIDTILENTRTALDKAGLEAPYILCPHSMSGIEALYWAQKYPDEVSAIIGLDMSVPEAYEELKLNPFLMQILRFGANIGITRIGSFSESAAIQGGTLTEEEKEIYRAVFFTRTMTNDMINEAANIKDGAAAVKAGELPDIPILMFCSDGSAGTGFTKERWQKIQTDFAHNSNAHIVYLDCGHYVHDYEYIKISQDMKSFLQ